MIIKIAADGLSKSTIVSFYWPACLRVVSHRKLILVIQYMTDVLEELSS